MSHKDAFKFKGKTYFRGPWVHTPFGSRREILKRPLPERCPECGAVHPVPVSDEMIDRALRAWPPNGQPYVARDVMREALLAALNP